MNHSQRLTRRGMAILLVLGVLAITLAVCYATLRGQGATAQLARNNSRALQAREAAHSGLAAALRKMSEAGWAGVNVPLNSYVTPDSWYEVTFSTGDPTLTAGHPKFGEYPYRVTINSTGLASDPSDPTIRAIHKSRCVVQLIRKAIASEPPAWPKLTSSTVYQWGNRNTYLQEPVRINGRTTILGRIYLSTEYPLTTPSKERYLGDLKQMSSANRGDHRPVESPLYVAVARQDLPTMTLLNVNLGLLTIDTLDSTANPLTHPGAVTSYQLYPGGRSYAPPVLQLNYGSAVQDLTLAPDPVANPLGVFRSSGTLTINNNVSITGTLISETTMSEIYVAGTNVVVQAANLPKLYGSNTVVQLPATIARDSIFINSAAAAQWKGFTMVWDDFDMKKGAATTQFTMVGNLATAGLMLRGREPWTMTSTAWNNDYNDYMGSGGLLPALLNALFNTIRAALGIPSGEPVYFPEYMQHVRGFTIQPTLTFQPDLSGVQPHWQDWSQPVFQKGPGDEGLCWDVIRWEDNL
ncbi:MAG TPA: hypothetical protein VFB80_14725 [Pirellulaceae bacterium]|nr:hypothetical protein [Pirellulaceae bacterium]